MKPKAVLFDMDGVIALTEYIKAEAHVETIQQLGGKASANIYLEMIGQSHEKIRTAFIKASGVNVDPTTYSKIFRKIYNKLITEKLEIRPGARNLVKELRKRGFLLGIVSSSSLSSIKQILTTGKMLDDFTINISSEDVKENKPSPEPYLLALNQLGIEPDDALTFEDSSTGIESARGAGIRAIAVRHDHNSNQNFDGTLAVLDSFLDTNTILDMIDKVLHISEE